MCAAQRRRLYSTTNKVRRAANHKAVLNALSSRKDKHIEKTGHVRNPEDSPGGLPDGMFYIPENMSARHIKGQLMIE